MSTHLERDLTEIREALAALLNLASVHVVTDCGHVDCLTCPRNRAILKRAKGALMLLTPATLLPVSDKED